MQDELPSGGDRESGKAGNTSTVVSVIISHWTACGYYFYFFDGWADTIQGPFAVQHALGAEGLNYLLGWLNHFNLWP